MLKVQWDFVVVCSCVDFVVSNELEKGEHRLPDELQNYADTLKRIFITVMS